MVKTLAVVAVLVLAGCGREEPTCLESLGVPRDASCTERPGGGVLQCTWAPSANCTQSLTFNADACEPLTAFAVCD